MNNPITNQDTCPVCGLAHRVASQGHPTGDQIQFNCAVCGSYRLTGTAEATARSMRVSPKLSAWLRETHENGGSPPLIDSYFLNEIDVRIPDLSVADRMTRLLQNIAKRTEYPGDTVDLDTEIDRPLAWAQNADEFTYYVRGLCDRGFVSWKSFPGGGISVSIAPSGWEYLDKVRGPGMESAQAFVAMSFSPEMNPAWEDGIRPAVEQAGYKPLRVDSEPHLERIDVKIISEIKRSRFVIADFTGQRAGVYFEAGYALALNLPVFWCVRSDELKSLHFDTRQFNHIEWSTPHGLAEKLYNFIYVVVGPRER